MLYIFFFHWYFLWLFIYVYVLRGSIDIFSYSKIWHLTNVSRQYNWLIKSSYRDSFVDHTTLFLCSLHWLPVTTRIHFKTLALQMAQVHPTSRTWLNHSIIQALLLATPSLRGRSSCCSTKPLLFAVLMISPSTGQDSRTSTIADWTLICSDCTLAHEKNKDNNSPCPPPKPHYLYLNLSIMKQFSLFDEADLPA